jgi:DNA-binding MarR family transcriptional regulator/N-acetylglutamate synthase-like GNAT family acetyltransferase
MAETPIDQHVDAVRRFNRFYTKQIGLLQDGYLDSPFSLTEVRVLYELAHGGQPTASALGRDLGLDASYLSRILRRFEKTGLIARETSRFDGRQKVLRLTEEGRRVFAPLDARSRDGIAGMLEALSVAKRDRLVGAMRTVEEVLGDAPVSHGLYVLRSHRPGDMGWVVHRHGVLYAREYGWDETFEALVASIVAAFIQNVDPKRERCWIAERDGEMLGSVLLVKQSEDVAKLRLLLVEPSARDLGLGTRLVQECIAFARSAGYAKVTLWTNDVLHAARRIYEGAGFRLVHQAPHHSFGHDLVEQTWVLDL